MAVKLKKTVASVCPQNHEKKEKERNQSGSEGFQLCIYSETEQTAHDTAAQNNFKNPKNPFQSISVICISTSSLEVELFRSSDIQKLLQKV